MKRALWILCLLSPALSWNAAGAAEALGRLFFTPAQRHTFDSGKQLASSPKAAPPGPQTAKLNGVVTRSDGETTVWINGRTIGKRDPPIKASASAADPAAARVELPDSKKTVRLKVGQRYIRSTGKIIESYQHTRPDSNPPAPGPTQQNPLNQEPAPGPEAGRAADTSDRNERSSAN